MLEGEVVNGGELAGDSANLDKGIVAEVASEVLTATARATHQSKFEATLTLSMSECLSSYLYRQGHCGIEIHGERLGFTQKQKRWRNLLIIEVGYTLTSRGLKGKLPLSPVG